MIQITRGSVGSAYPTEPVLLTYHFALCKLYTEPLLSTKFLYKGYYIDAAYQVSVHLAKQFQRRRFFRNLLIRNNQNYLWWPCLLTDWNEISNLNRGPFIVASCQVSVHLAKQFQWRSFKCEKLTRQRRQGMGKVHMTFRPGELNS
jgi:hypothetical protein